MIGFKRENMDSKKIFFLPIIISIIGHVVLISVSSMIDLRNHVKTAELFMVNIAQPQPDPGQKEEEKPKTEKEPQKTQEAKPVPSAGREDTVDIGSSDIKYAAYLAGVKKKIMRIWQYPGGAYQNSEEGDVVVKITVEADGSLAQIALMTSSGSEHLDSGTLGTVQAAAPFEPLPPQYDLSRLNIIASFRYRMRD